MPDEGQSGEVTEFADELADESDEEEEKEVEDFDEAEAKLKILTRFVGTDWTGGDLERLAFHSFWDHRFLAVGDEAVVTGHALSSFMSELALERPSTF